MLLHVNFSITQLNMPVNIWVKSVFNMIQLFSLEKRKSSIPTFPQVCTEKEQLLRAQTITVHLYKLRQWLYPWWKTTEYSQCHVFVKHWIALYVVQCFFGQQSSQLKRISRPSVKYWMRNVMNCAVLWIIHTFALGLIVEFFSHYNHIFKTNDLLVFFYSFIATILSWSA